MRNDVKEGVLFATAGLILFSLLAWAIVCANQRDKADRIKETTFYLRIYDDPASPPWLKTEARKRLFPDLEESK